MQHMFSYKGAPLLLAHSSSMWNVKAQGSPQSSHSILLGSGNTKYLPKTPNGDFFFLFLHNFKSHNIYHMLCCRQRGGLPEESGLKHF